MQIEYEYENLFTHIIADIRLHISKKEQSCAYVYILKPTTHFLFFFSIIYALLIICVTINGTVARTALLL